MNQTTISYHNRAAWPIRGPGHQRIDAITVRHAAAKGAGGALKIGYRSGAPIVTIDAAQLSEGQIFDNGGAGWNVGGAFGALEVPHGVVVAVDWTPIDRFSRDN